MSQLLFKLALIWDDFTIFVRKFRFFFCVLLSALILGLTIYIGFNYIEEFFVGPPEIPVVPEKVEELPPVEEPKPDTEAEKKAKSSSTGWTLLVIGVGIVGTVVVVVVKSIASAAGGFGGP